MQADAEPLRRLDGRQMDRALEALREDMPHSVHVVNTMLTGARWMEDRKIDVDFAVYRPVEEGDDDHGLVTVITIMRMEGVVPIIAMHTTDRSCRSLRRALQRSRFIPWDEDIVFDNSHDDWVTPAVLEAVHDHGDVAPHTHPNEQMYLPRDDALKLDVSSLAHPSYVVEPLDAHQHAAIINDLWPHKVRGSIVLLRNLITANAGFMSCAAYRVVDGERASTPAAWVMTTFYGGVGMLHTLEDHRRQGLASFISAVVCRAEAAAGLDPICNVGHYNKGSLNMFRQLGFKRAFDATYLEYRPPKKEH